MQADSTFAHSGNNFDTDIIIDLSVSDSDESEEVLGIAVSEESPNNATSACRNTIAAKIDKFFGKYKVPLTGFGCDFDLHGQESKVDPLMIASIAWCESTGGKVTPQFQGKESYNAWGWAVYDSNETTKSVNGYSCDSWDHCIGRVTRGIARNSEKRNLTSLPEHVVTWYNPGSVQRAGGEPTESSWYKCVSGTIDKMNAL